MSKFHLAQFNVAWLLEPMEHPRIKDFRDAIDPIHDLAEEAPGFVWRLAEDGQADAVGLRPLGEDGVINCTVWETREAMEAFVYKGVHGKALKRRMEWFHPPEKPSVVLWWVPAGHHPTLEEALGKLELLRASGGTAEAFSPRQRFSPPSS